MVFLSATPFCWCYVGNLLASVWCHVLCKCHSMRLRCITSILPKHLDWKTTLFSCHCFELLEFIKCFLLSLNNIHPRSSVEIINKSDNTCDLQVLWLQLNGLYLYVQATFALLILFPFQIWNSFFVAFLSCNLHRVDRTVPLSWKKEVWNRIYL